MNGNCSACNIKIDINYYKRDRTVCKTCYNKNERKNNNNTIPRKTITASHQQAKLKTLKITITKTDHSSLDFQVVVKHIL